LAGVSCELFSEEKQRKQKKTERGLYGVVYYSKIPLMGAFKLKKFNEAEREKQPKKQKKRD